MTISRLTTAALSSLDSAAAELDQTTTLSQSRSSSISSLTSIDGLDKDEEERTVPKRKKKKVAGRGWALKTGKGKGKENATGALPTPSPTSDGSRGAIKPSRRQRASIKEKDHGDGKEYLSAGLYYSEDSTAPPPPSKASKTKYKKADFDWRDIGEPKALPLPIHYGESLIEEERPFRLPFDILRDCYFDACDKGVVSSIGIKRGDADTLEKMEKSRKPEPYRSIAKNCYVERKPEKAELPAICACKLPAHPNEVGCGQSCINRMMQYTCNPKTCRLGERCSNIPLGQKKGIPEGKNGLRVVWTGNRGFGLKTMVPIAAGQFVTEYRGEIISRDESYRRVLTTYKEAKSYYFLDYDGHEVIDAGQRGNASRFINHSCGPNLEVVRWKLSGFEEYQMGIFALHDIPADTELTYDYGWQDFSALKPNPNADPVPVPVASTSDSIPVEPARQHCYCGADVCSGFLGGKKKNDKKEKTVVPSKSSSSSSSSSSSAGAKEVKEAGGGDGKIKTAMKVALAKLKKKIRVKKTAAKVAGVTGLKKKGVVLASRQVAVLAGRKAPKPRGGV